MSAVIKAAEARAVRSLELVPVENDAVEWMEVPAPRSSEAVALDEARELILRLQAQRDAADETHRDECAEAYAAGLKAGAEQADDGAERRLRHMRETAAAALDAWHARLGELDILAVMLARGAAARLFSPHADLADLLARAISAKVAHLHAESVVAVRVNGEDFAEGATPADAGSGVELIVDPRLKRGECQIDLRLGAVDLTIDGLAHELDAFFTSLEEPA